MMQLFKSSTKETMNFLRYVGPGLLVTVGFIDPGNWASNIAKRFRLWIYVIMDGHIINDHAHYLTA